MKILLDTNVWIASFLTHGACQELVEYCLEGHTLIISRFITDEIEEKLFKKFNFPRNRIREILGFLKNNSILIKAAILPSPVCRDPDDDQVLAAMAGGNADCLITGDNDLLVLKEFQGIPILRPNQFWSFEKK